VGDAGCPCQASRELRINPGPDRAAMLFGIEMDIAPENLLSRPAIAAVVAVLRVFKMGNAGGKDAFISRSECPILRSSPNILTTRPVVANSKKTKRQPVVDSAS